MNPAPVFLLALLSFPLPLAAQETAETPDDAEPAVEIEVAPVPVERLEQRGNWQWHVLRDEGREYVRFEDVHQFYRFETMDVVGDEVILESVSPPITLRFLAGLRQAQIKGYKVYLSFAPKRFEDRLYLSRVDLALLVDAVLRPTVGMPEGFEPSVLIRVEEGQALALEVAGHLKQGLEAFGMKAITELPKATDEEPVKPIMARLQLTQQGASDELSTQTLAPYGTPVHEEVNVPEGETRGPGNERDGLNVAFGMALHAALMENVEGVLDGGLRRARSKFLKEAQEPAVSIVIPADTTASAEVLGASLVRGLRSFREVLEKKP